jgi:hypothetical protein
VHSKFHVQADALDPDRSAIVVEGRIFNALEVESREEAG